MIVTAEISIAMMGLLCVIAFLLLMGFLAWANPGTNSGFLEWDPEATSAWRGEVERADLEDVLARRNVERAARGLEPQSMEQYAEELRRDADA